MLNKLKRAALGAHTPHDKATAASKPVPMPLPAQVRILMSQHIGAPAKALVKKGDEVFVGTKIGEAGGFVSANIHSSVSGTVAAVEPFRLSNGRTCDSVVIKTDGKQTVDPAVKAPEVTDKASFLAAVRECGLVVAEGVNTLQQDLAYADAMAALPSDYKRVTTSVDKTEILYAINKANVTKKALKDADLEAFQANVDENLKNDRATQHVAVKGYASPDGPVKFNDTLSKERSESGDKVLAKLLKNSGLDIDVAAYGEDWEGFKELVSKSNIKDKDLILQVLSMYSSSTQREDEIKNMSSVFNELKKDILPQLRRSVIVNTIDLEGKTDAEMMALVEAGKLDQLNLNELLFVAESIAQDNATKNIVLAYAAEKYNDARAYNNLGIVLTEEGRTADALKCFQKAAQLGEASEALNTNLALANLANGNMAEAQKYAKGADAKAKSLVNAAQGNYNDAAKQLDGMNAAIANTMNKDYAAAKRAIAKDMSAEADYLRAVIASEEGDMRTAEAQLKSAVKKDEKMAKKAMKDIHFKKLFEEGLKF